MNDLSPYEFDQTDKGWAALDQKGLYLQAAVAIQHYITINKAKIASQHEVSIQTLYFHAGQEYAMAGEEFYKKACEQMRMAYKSNNDWNAYVDGTIAFLERNIEALKDATQRLDILAQLDDRLTQNAKLLRAFQANSEETYASIYDRAS